MVDKLSGFMRKRRDTKLYQQWVTRDGLPPEEVPQEPESGGSDMEDMTEDDFYRAIRRENVDSKSITLPVRYILLGSGILAILLVLVAILATILAMQSC